MTKHITHIPAGKTVTISEDCTVDSGASIDGTLKMQRGTLTIQSGATINGTLKILGDGLSVNGATLRGNIETAGDCKIDISNASIYGACKIESDFKGFKTVTLENNTFVKPETPYSREHHFSVCANHIVIKGSMDLPDWTWLNTKKIDAPECDVPPHAEFLADFSIVVRDIMSHGCAHATHRGGTLSFNNLYKNGKAIAFDGQVSGHNVAGKVHCHVGEFDILDSSAHATASKKLTFDTTKKGAMIDGSTYFMSYKNLGEILERSQPSIYDRDPDTKDALYIPGPGEWDIRPEDEQIEVSHGGAKAFAKDAAQRTRACPHPTLDVKCNTLKGVTIQGVKTVTVEDTITDSTIAISDGITAAVIKNSNIRGSVDVPSHFIDDTGKVDPIDEQPLKVEIGKLEKSEIVGTNSVKISTMKSSTINGAETVHVDRIKGKSSITADTVAAQSVSRLTTIHAREKHIGPDQGEGIVR